MKRIVLILLAFVLIVVPAYSVPELWSGISFLGEVEQTSSAFMDRGYFEEYSSSNITRLGFRMRGSIFPDYDVPLGVSAIADFLFPVGSGGKSFISHNFDYKTNLAFALTYQPSFSPTWGMMLSAELKYSIFRTAMNNIANKKDDPGYNYFTSSSAALDLGFFIRHKNSFFEVGGFFSYCISHPASFSYGLFVGGGIILA